MGSVEYRGYYLWYLSIETEFNVSLHGLSSYFLIKSPFSVRHYVNHNLIEAIMFGAAAHVVVEGEWNHDLMTQVKPPK